MMRQIGNHIHAAILRAIAAEAGLDPLDREKPILTIESISSEDWASVTFVGARHEFALRICGSNRAVVNAVERLTQGLPDREIAIAGHIVAEIGVRQGKTTRRDGNSVDIALAVSALTIED